MKVLVTYFSQTGNTETIAKAVADGLGGSHEVELKKLEEVDAGGLGGYEVVFLGTPIHAGGLAGPVGEFLKALPSDPGFCVAGLVTHASAIYMKEAYERGLKALEDGCADKSIKYLGLFNCQGRLSPAIQPMVQKAQKLSDEEWARRMAETDPHPDADDEAAARKFAVEALGKV